MAEFEYGIKIDGADFDSIIRNIDQFVINFRNQLKENSEALDNKEDPYQLISYIGSYKSCLHMNRMTGSTLVQDTDTSCHCSYCGKTFNGTVHEIKEILNMHTIIGLFQSLPKIWLP